ncbi:MAG: hypothetical protein JWP78_2649 [Mucilaginibacter sp.]|nr:hypothetical protein [Mucilaginibacter sp.]
MTQLNRINYYNIVAMLASACLAVIIPFELVLLSYAILGPAHYLTEISWLKGKQFFTLKKYDYLIIVAILIVALVFRFSYANILFYTFGLSLLLLLIKGNIKRMLAAIILIIAGYFLLSHNIPRTIFGLYMPTLIHVYVFTGAFLLLGALKNKNVSGYISFFTFLICPLLLCTLFTAWHRTPIDWGVINYGSFTRLNTTTLRIQAVNIYTNGASILLTRVIAFAYTYHYLNWFSKTPIINWHRISLTRAVIIGLMWAASVTLYFYNYRIGYKWLFLLSLLHVVLEFPLNHRSFMGIGKELKNRLSLITAK